MSAFALRFVRKGAVAIGGLSTPSLAIASALGAAPLVLSLSDPDYVVGLYGQVQISSILNDTAFLAGNLTQNLIFFIDGESWARLDEAVGLLTPPGAYSARWRVCQDNDSGSTTVTGTDPNGNALSFTADVSGWSNIVNDTITVTTTILDSTKRCTNNAIIQNSPLYGASLQLTGADQIVEQCAGTTNSVPVGAKYYSEHKVTGIQYGSSGVGIADGTFVWATSLGSAPPATNKGAGLNRNRTIVPSGSTTMGAESLNDFVQMCVKRSGTTSVTVWIGKNNSWVNGDPSAETGGETVALNDEGGGVYHCFGYVFVLGATDVIQNNFGQVAFNYTKPTGATAWN